MNVQVSWPVTNYYIVCYRCGGPECGYTLKCLDTVKHLCWTTWKFTALPHFSHWYVRLYKHLTPASVDWSGGGHSMASLFTRLQRRLIWGFIRQEYKPSLPRNPNGVKSKVTEDEDHVTTFVNIICVSWTRFKSIATEFVTVNCPWFLSGLKICYASAIVYLIIDVKWQEWLR